ncbi:MAG: flavodoxin domain-containing protein [Acetobacteraceae bacterium]|nr:flavodoxin domain-containing protein [Acetobacteraceae bacterium]
MLSPSPFPPDQLDGIKRLVAGSTPEQRQWLSGYLAGYLAASGGAAVAPAPAAPAGPKTPVTILYGTESGNTETLAGAVRKSAQRLGFAPKVLDMADATPEQLASAGNVIVLASTWGEGDPPQRAESFYAALMADTAPQLPDLRYAVLALGDRAYANFCEIGKRIDERLATLGAKRIADRADCDVDYEAAAKTWIDGTLRDLQGETGAAVIHVDFAKPAHADDDAETWNRNRPFEAEITAAVNLNSSRSTSETHHIELTLEGSGITYEPGDALGIVPTNDPQLVADVLKLSGLTGNAGVEEALAERLDITTLIRDQIGKYAAITGNAELSAIAADADRALAFMRDRQFVDLLAAAPAALAPEQLTDLLRPLPARLYSIASSRALVGDEAHILVGAVNWESYGRKRKGVASGYLAERTAPGKHVKVYVKPNTHFRLPADQAAPVIMIGPGTGVAPFRAFMQGREATGATGRNWLFFGARNYLHDFLYQLEWQDWAKSGQLTRIDLAFSRDQREKIYVQNRMWDARRDLFAWLEEGASVYVCGDAKAMAKDVQDTLLSIIADQSGGGEEAATTYLRGLTKAGRYLKDVY